MISLYSKVIGGPVLLLISTGFASFVDGGMPNSSSPDEIASQELLNVENAAIDVVHSPNYVQWKRTYNSVYNDTDEATGMAISPDGNIWVTGKSERLLTGFDFMTVIYDSDGNEIGQIRHNGSANGNDIPHAVITDSNSNGYVTGQSWGSGTREDFLTIKYDSLGNEVWSRRYDGPSLDLDIARAMALDSQGNIYVTGGSYTGTHRSIDFCTVKYNSNGNLKWVKRYNGLGNWEDYAVSIAVDGEDNIIVTGHAFQGFTNEYDITTCKYDSSGNVLWVKKYNGPASEGDYPIKLVTDSSDNVIVCGYSRAYDSARDYVIIKYYPDGTVHWIRRYNGPNYQDDYPADLIVDSNDNIYITGRSIGIQGNDDFATIKYDPDGNRLWVERFGGIWGDNDRAYAMTIDYTGNVYVTGTSFDPGEGYDDIMTLKYDSDGTLLWFRFCSGLHMGEDRPTDVVFDGTGGLYVTGSVFNGPTNDMDYLTIKYSP